MRKLKNKKQNGNGHRLLIFCILCLFGFYVVDAGLQRKQEKREQSKSKVILLHADDLFYDQYKNPGAQILTGNVAFQHEGVFMYCDSACLYEATNSFDAFGHVKMVQGDTLTLVGDVLFYNGLDQLARVRHNVVLTHRESKLYTDSLDYDRLYDLGYFFEGGKLVDKDNVLTSEWGQYSTSTREAVFNYNVKLVNPRFTLISDTLNYNTRTSMAEIVGPSNIDSGDNHIYSESGFYDTQNERAYLLQRSILTNKGKKLIGDSLYYDSQTGIGKAYWNIIYTDEINKNMFTGNYCFYNELTGYSEATDSAVAIDFSQKDTMYMHADTFKIYTFNINTDSVYREMRAYHKVRSYRVDVQGVCDSLVYNTKDSCMTMYKDPIVWNGGQQLLGEVIHVYMNDSTIERVHVIDQTLSVEQIDSVHYNQIAGKEMISYFKNGEMDHTWVNGNVYIDYYLFDDDSLMIGMNYTETTELKLYMKDRKMNKIWMPASTGTIYPEPLIPPNKLYLSNFAWFDYIRPKDKNDIFVWRPKKAGTELKVSRRRQAPLQKLDNLIKKK